LGKINDLQKRRNELIHGEYWHGSNNTLDLILIRPSNNKPEETQPVHLSQLKEHAQKVQDREIQLDLAISQEPQNNMPNTYWRRRYDMLRKNYYRDLAMAQSRGEPEPPRPAWLGLPGEFAAAVRKMNGEAP